MPVIGADRRGERGAASIEMTVAVTSFLLATFLAVGGLRITTARSEVSAASRAAARAAAQGYDLVDGASRARTVAADALAGRGLSCADLDVEIGGELRPGGIVTATVTCQVDLSDVALVGFPGRTTIRSTGAELVDVVRGGEA